MKHLAIVTLFAASSALGQGVGIRDGVPYIPDTVLMPKNFTSWSYTVKPSSTQVPLSQREPKGEELRVIEKASTLLASKEAKVVALIDGRDIVYLGYKAPADDSAIFNAASVSKTVTAMAVGQAVCANKLKLEDTAEKWIPELKGKALGSASVRDLLRMASGSTEPSNPDCAICANVFSSDDLKKLATGTLNLTEVVSSDRVASAQKGVFSSYKPGEQFVYKATDPILLGLIVSKATETPFATWLQQTIFDPAGVTGPGNVAQTRLEQVLADYGVRLTLKDWVRFAVWVKESSKKDDCFASYIKQATTTQIPNKVKKAGQLFDGYGYLTWTDNKVAPGTFWASGYGGQRIGWSYDNDRMIVIFSNHENWMSDVYTLFKVWSSVR